MTDCIMLTNQIEMSELLTNTGHMEKNQQPLSSHPTSAPPPPPPLPSLHIKRD